MNYLLVLLGSALGAAAASGKNTAPGAASGANLFLVGGKVSTWTNEESDESPQDKEGMVEVGNGAVTGREDATKLGEGDAEQDQDELQILLRLGHVHEQMQPNQYKQFYQKSMNSDKTLDKNLMKIDK